MDKLRPNQEAFSRRGFLRLAALVGAGALLASCAEPTKPTEERQPAAPKHETTAPSPANTEMTIERYQWHRVKAKVTWIGQHSETAWDSNPVARFGGEDNPRRRRKNGLPAGFTPKHNPYYVALPALEIPPDGDDDKRLRAEERSPWADKVKHLGEDESLFKGRWLEITTSHGAKAYAQWLDVGPTDTQGISSTDPQEQQKYVDNNGDYDYVFGDAGQAPKHGNPGIGLSPALAISLGYPPDTESAGVKWRFVDAADVPVGPWKQEGIPPIDNIITYGK